MITFLAGDDVETIHTIPYGDDAEMPAGTLGQVVEDSSATTTRVSFPAIGKFWLPSDGLKLIAHHPLRVAADAQASKPDYVTAADFVAQDYAAKIARGECVVTLKGGVTPIRDIEEESGIDETYRIHWKLGGVAIAMGNALYVVTWLSQPAAAPTASGEGDEETWSDDGIGDLIAEAKVANNRMNDTARAALEHRTPDNEKKADLAAQNSGLYLTLLIDALQQRNVEHAAVRSQLEAARAENTRLREALEQATHYSSIELPQMSETAQLSWLQSMRSHTLDILQSAALAGSEGAGNGKH